MTITVKDLDGARGLEIEIRGASVFLEGAGFCYEFDAGIFWHGLRRELAQSMNISTDAICIDSTHALIDEAGRDEAPKLV